MSQAALHAIKYHILERLRVAPAGLKFAEMRPDEVENDRYNYHLQQLVRRGLLVKNHDRYLLTNTGKMYLIELNPVDELGVTQHVKLASMCVVIDRSAAEPVFLYQRRTRQPLAGQVQIIGGGIRRGEDALAAARRRLLEEAGLEANFSVMGMLRYRRFDLSHQLYSDILFHVCLAEAYTGTLVPRNEFGEQFWLPATEAVALEQSRRSKSSRLGEWLADLARHPEPTIPMFYTDDSVTEDMR